MQCSQCNHTIPDKVVFCAYCGAEVRRAQMLQPLRFPQSESAADRAGLVGCCSRHWDYARDKLYDGTVERWLRSEVSVLFDPVLADQAHAIVQQQKQPDIGLDQFLRALEPIFPLPRLETSPAQLDAGAVPWQQRRELPFEIHNVGSGCFSGQVNSNAVWLSVQPATLTCVAGRKVVVTASVDTQALQIGQVYQTRLEMQGNLARAKSVSVTVAVPEPALKVSPPTLDLGTVNQGEQLVPLLQVCNTGGSALDAHVHNTQHWLKAQLADLRVDPGCSAEILLSADTTQLLAGEYVTDVLIQAQMAAWKDEVAVPVRVTIPAPRLELTPTTLDLGIGYQGERLTQPVTLYNRGGSAFEAEIASSARWLEAQPRTVRLGPGQCISVTVAADTGKMRTGAHTAQAQVTARAGTWQAQTTVPVAVSLPKLRTLQYRWGAMLDYAAAGLVGLVVLLFALRWLEISVGFWLGLAQAATWAMLLGSSLGIYLARRKKPAYWRYSGVGAIVVGCVAVIGLGYLWTQPTQRLSCYDQGIAFRESGDWQQSIAAFERCGDYRDALQQIPETFKQQAQAAMETQDWEMAMAIAEQARSMDAAQGLILLAEVYTRQAQVAMAAQDWETAAAIAEQVRAMDAAQGLGLLTEAYTRQAQAALAAQDWMKAGIAATYLRGFDSELGTALWEELPPEAHAVVSRTRPMDGMVQVYVPAGAFQMGSEDGRNDERPVYTVTLDGFWLDQTEVTNAQYRNCVATEACEASTFADDARFNGTTQPMVGISWDDAVAYCAWAGGRLPREAEWAYAAGGPSGWLYPWGNTWEENSVNCYEADCRDGYEYTAPVGSFPQGASWVEALNLAGNVQEWTADWYGEYPAGQRVNPTGPASGTSKVLRGGSFFTSLSYVRIACRSDSNPANRSILIGFRCAGDAPGN
ncbi:MAG: SUMF1/EgtB/PvdO family nonheme iron enzyme [Anaerolineae bacterium]|nr:SUMF1/EgtB/PvdO family nonheme iron enzyme [Anaerolineae bacterium]